MAGTLINVLEDGGIEEDLRHYKGTHAMAIRVVPRPFDTQEHDVARPPLRGACHGAQRKTTGRDGKTAGSWGGRRLRRPQVATGSKL